MFSARLSYAVTDPAAIALLQGLTEATERKGYELHLLPGHRGTGLEVEAVREAVVGGFCLYCMPDDHPALTAALERRLPIVVVDEPRIAGTFFVGIEDEAGARAAARHLRELGHEHVAVIVDRLRDDGTGDRIIDAQRIADGYYRVSRERIAGWFDGLGGPVPVYEAERERAGGGRPRRGRAARADAAADRAAVRLRPALARRAGGDRRRRARRARRHLGDRVRRRARGRARRSHDRAPAAAGEGATGRPPAARARHGARGDPAGRARRPRDDRPARARPRPRRAYGTVSGPLSM